MVPRRSLFARIRNLGATALVGSGLFLLDMVAGCTLTEEEEPKAYYGPAPADAMIDEDTGPDAVDPDAGNVDDATTVPDAVLDDAMVAYYGPQPVDAGPDPADVGDECEPMAYYGPQPCDTDEECVERHGEGWYCNTESTVDNGCGDDVVWPVCEQ